MDSGSLITGLVILALFVLPIIILGKKNKKD